MSVKFGMDQVNSPAPKGWRNFERAYIVAFSPALAGFLSVVLTHDRHLAIAASAIVFSNGMVKAIGIFLGNGTEYAEINETNETQNQ